ncbi:ABC transporter permease [Opitutus terrae]|uniref:Transport permease protein n=1 Tax=Opitutus terrae (strain DSM 11246 / JCM 15787 / PB90-1) TaxID=452637 RepID=B1ZW99_OPITP|nr:ABC transporter permease [Opitutus terrae]ACB76851.1 ABC-2 type transporter [Opitutus terrae PB90-1]
MSGARPWAGALRHFWVTLQLNSRSKQAIGYGYLLPVFFLLAFGSVFRGGEPLLLDQMGQLLTITILGTASIGLPTALVAERERGVWRRYRLLPVSTARLLAGTLLARLVIVVTAVALQVVLARLIYDTPLPQHPFSAFAALLVVTFAFLGLGLVVAALANDVPSVQALGQCLFLPMIMIGGVGVPLSVLPAWAQRVAGFMPGRYAVEALQSTFNAPAGLRREGFAVLALLVIGAAAAGVGLKLFRWDPLHRAGRTAGGWIAVALLAWLGVGLTASVTGRLAPIGAAGASYETITDEELEQIRFDDLTGDNELVTRLARPFDAAAAERIRPFLEKLHAWPPGQVTDPVQHARNLLSVAAIADVTADLQEAQIGRAVFDELQARYPRPQLRRILGWIILNPDGERVITATPELGLRREINERAVRQRSIFYAKKFLGRLLGKLPD